MFFSTLPFDLQLFLLINQQWHTPLLDVIMPILSSRAVLAVSLAVAVAAMTALKGKRQLVYFLVLFAALGIADFTTSQVKAQIFRVRPLNALAETRYVDDEGNWQQRPSDFVRTKERGTSYPSGHAANTAALAVLASLLWPALKKWPLLLPVIVGYSRIYLGKHYPTDVLAGWLWGMVIAGGIWLIWRELEPRLLPKDIP